jgi:SAM-dependent methyltransferase
MMTLRHSFLGSWWHSATGQNLLAAESELLGEALEDVFGWELLQVGEWGRGRELLARSRTRHQTIISTDAHEGSADVIGRPSQLPVNSDSVDAVILPHTLEFATDPYAIVREVDRVLAAEGHLLILGFRPLSLWGLRARMNRAGYPPGLRRLLSARRVREWLVLLGYEIVSEERYLYRSPWSRGAGATAGVESVLRRGLLNIFPAGAWWLKARKRVYTLTPIRPRFREKSPVISPHAVPTARTSVTRGT